jgi:hypothetical protein
MEIDGGVSQIPGGHATRRSMRAFDELVTDRKSGLHFNEAGSTVFHHLRIGLSIADELHRLQVLLTRFDSLLYSVL